MKDFFQIASSLTGMEDLVCQLERIAVAWKLTTGQLFEINLIIEEIGMNYIEHTQAGPDNLIGIELSLDKEMFSITITDSGPEFDLTKVADPDVHSPIEQRKPGGLGLYLVKNLAQNINYSRQDDRNVLCIQAPLKAK